MDNLTVVGLDTYESQYYPSQIEMTEEEISTLVSFVTPLISLSKVEVYGNAYLSIIKVFCEDDLWKLRDKLDKGKLVNPYPVYSVTLPNKAVVSICGIPEIQGEEPTKYIGRYKIAIKKEDILLGSRAIPVRSKSGKLLKKLFESMEFVYKRTVGEKRVELWDLLEMGEKV